MKVTTITYQALKNLGNYESERLEATADVESGEDPMEVFAGEGNCRKTSDDAALALRRWVNLTLNAPPNSIMGKPQEDPPDDSLDDY